MRRRTPLTLKARAVQWLSMREHSRLELRGKLIRHVSSQARQAERLRSPHAQASNADTPEGDEVAVDPNTTPQAIDALLDELQAKGLLSDERFAASRLRLRAPKLGARRIEAELRHHGVEPDASLSNELRDSEYSRAVAVWRKKFGGATARDRADVARQARFLASRGFDAEVIARVVRAGDDAVA